MRGSELGLPNRIYMSVAVTARLPPLLRRDDSAEADAPEAVPSKRLSPAWGIGLDVTEKAPSLHRRMALHFKEGLVMAIGILPSVSPTQAAGNPRPFVLVKNRGALISPRDASKNAACSVLRDGAVGHS